ncbi:MAG: hypothetical protein KDB16_15430, partial [Acidimicrobiales bacterium]|nr:hypothetical protein [Acidimicrobiales bacterium]
MPTTDIQAIVEAGFDEIASIGSDTTGDVRYAVLQALDLLDSGELRVAEKVGGEWVVNEWVKKAVLLSFRLHDNQVIGGGPGHGT